MKKILIIIGLCSWLTGFAQQDSSITKQQPALSFSGYAEVYYSYDLNKPANNTRPGFIYSHNRHNEFNLNLGFLKAAYSTEKLRANLAVAAGTYMNANYSAESGTLKNIYEANAGIKISNRHNLWIDAGVFSSHIGFESAISKDCWNLTRSLLAENSPYFETGAKITYTSKNNQWIMSGLVLNGWQRIQRVEGNSLLSFGTQVQYKPTASATINYSTLIGTDKPDSVRLMRYFNNLYAVFKVTKKLAFTTGIDVGMEQQSKGSNKMNTWYSPVLIAKYAVCDQWSIAARAEYYSDKNGVIIATGTENGFRTAGFSANVDYSPVSNAVIRLEARTLNSKDPLFIKGDRFSDNNTFFTSSIAITF